MTQVISFHPGGAVSGLQVKPGKGLNLQTLGRAETVRASEIVWDTDAQAWKIDVLQDAGKGVVTWWRFREATDAQSHAETHMRMREVLPGTSYYHPFRDRGAPPEQNWQIAQDIPDDITDGTMLFTSYEDAVKVEIAFLDALRLRGQH